MILSDDMEDEIARMEEGKVVGENAGREEGTNLLILPSVCEHLTLSFPLLAAPVVSISHDDMQDIALDEDEDISNAEVETTAIKLASIPPVPRTIPGLPQTLCCTPSSSSTTPCAGESYTLFRAI
jgi:hypothetical protein